MIPKKIHYFWIGGNPKPESVLFCIESWKNCCPEYEIIEWNESNYDFTKNEYMRQAYDAKKWGFATDFGRLDVVYKYGGIYFDTDVEVIKPLDELLVNKAFMGFDQTVEREKLVANGLGFGAEPGFAILREMMEMYEKTAFIREDGSLNLLPTPYYSTRCLKKHGLRNEDCDQLIDGVMVYASDVLCPKSYNTGQIKLTDRTVSIHHFDATWMDAAQKKKHERSVKINSVLGVKIGSHVDRIINDTEYLKSAIKKRLVKK